MSVSDLIKKRYSCRKFDSKPVSKDDLLKLVDAAHLSPSARNLQTWKFFVVNNAAKNHAIGKKLMASSDGKFGNLEEKAKSSGCSEILFYDAPAVIYCCYKKEASVFSEFDMGMAVQNMCLVAESLGLCTTPVKMAPMINEELVKKEVGIPDDYVFTLALPVGYRAPDCADVKTTRKDDYVKYME